MHEKIDEDLQKHFTEVLKKNEEIRVICFLFRWGKDFLGKLYKFSWKNPKYFKFIWWCTSEIAITWFQTTGYFFSDHHENRKYHNDLKLDVNGIFRHQNLLLLLFHHLLSHSHYLNSKALHLKGLSIPKYILIISRTKFPL